MVGLHSGEQGGVRGLRADGAGGGGALDRRGLPRRRAGCERISGSPTEIAVRLRRAVLETRRPADHRRGGHARSSSRRWRAAVAKPDGLLVIPAGGELDFLHPLPVERLWGVGPATAEKLHAPRAADRRSGGRDCRAGARLDARARRRPPAPRALPQPRPTPGPASPAPPFVRRPVARSAARRRRPRLSTRCSSALVDRVTRRMRAKRRVGRTVALRMRFADFTRATRSHTLSRGHGHHADGPGRGARAAGGRHADDRAARAHARGSHRGNLEWASARDAARPALDGRSATALDAALDDVRDRFGAAAVTRAVLLGRAPRLATWLFPDEDD